MIHVRSLIWHIYRGVLRRKGCYDEKNGEEKSEYSICGIKNFYVGTYCILCN